MSLQTWVISTFTPIAEAAATAAAKAAVQELWGDIEKKIEDEFDQLPMKIIGYADKSMNDLLHDVTGTKEDIAGAVKSEVGPIIPTVDQFIQALASTLKSSIPGLGGGQPGAPNGGGLLPPWL